MGNLEQGIKAAKVGQHDLARQYLRQASKENPQDITAWLWLAAVLDNPRQRAHCLKRVLELDPNNQLARQALARLPQSAQTTKPKLSEKGKSKARKTRKKSRKKRSRKPVLAAVLTALILCLLIVIAANPFTSFLPGSTPNTVESSIPIPAPPEATAVPTSVNALVLVAPGMVDTLTPQLEAMGVQVWGSIDERGLRTYLPPGQDEAVSALEGVQGVYQEGIPGEVIKQLDTEAQKVLTIWRYSLKVEADVNAALERIDELAPGQIGAWNSNNQTTEIYYEPISINTVPRVEYRINDGNWQIAACVDVSSPNEIYFPSSLRCRQWFPYDIPFSATTPGDYTIELRVIDRWGWVHPLDSLRFTLTGEDITDDELVECERKFPHIAKQDSWLIGAYYYPWYGLNKRHWDEYEGKPALGEYNSKGRYVICRQIDWATGHGIDFFAVSWWGETYLETNKKGIVEEKETFENQALRDHFLTNPLVDDIAFAIVYESEGRLGKETILNHTTIMTLTNDFEYLDRIYFNHPRYLKTGDGQPIVFIYTTRGFTPDETVISVMKDLQARFNLYIVADQYQWEVPMSENLVKEAGYGAVTAYALKPTKKLVDPVEVETFIHDFPGVLAARKAEADRAGVAFVPDVIPAYFSANPKQPQQLIPRLSAEQFKTLLRASLDSLKDTDLKAPKMIMITTWNEWHEDTSIEPSTGAEGFKYLNALKEVLAEDLPPANHLLEWRTQETQPELLIPVDGEATAMVEFVSTGDPFPAGTTLGLYLHKDLNASTPGPDKQRFDSLFRNSTTWGKLEEFPDGPAFLVATTERAGRDQDGQDLYRFEFKLSGNNLSPDFCTEKYPLNGYCREDFGIAILGQNEWLLAEVGKGGRPGKDEDNLGFANVWYQIRLEPAAPPWWETIRQDLEDWFNQQKDNASDNFQAWWDEQQDNIQTWWDEQQEKFQKWLDEQWEDIQKQIEDYLAELWKEIEKAIIAAIDRLLRELIQACCGPGAILPFIPLGLLFLRRRSGQSKIQNPKSKIVSKENPNE